MAALEKGITPNGQGYRGKTWNILGQVYYPKAVTDSAFAFETNSDPGQFVPVHIHPTQDEFILVQDGVLDLKLDGVWTQARPAIWCACRAAFRMATSTNRTGRREPCFGSPRRRSWKRSFDKLHNLADPAEVVRISADHEVTFPPPEAND